MASTWIAVGALYCAAAVAAGAFGAHGLKARLDPAALALWETAARYLMYAGFGAVATGIVALVRPPGGLAAGLARGFDAAALLLLAGGLVFSATVAALALGGPRWLGAVTPLGGAALILGFVLLGFTVWRLG